MKAYKECPKCKTKDITQRVKGRTKKPYYTCICNECGNLYYQQYTDQETKTNEIKPDDTKQVPSLKRGSMDLMDDDIPPGKPVRNTTSQARL